MDFIKKAYARDHRVAAAQTERLNIRLFNTYNRIAIKVVGKKLSGTNLDLGCGDKCFSQICESKGIESYGFDYPEFNLETDEIDFNGDSVDFATMNAVIEHISRPGHMLSEVKRLLKSGGLLFVRTPNWQRDFRDFYNDPTHIKPYTPTSLRITLELAGFSVMFLEPGLVEKSWFWWRLPGSIKWWIASRLRGGSRSILAMAQKPGAKDHGQQTKE